MTHQQGIQMKKALITGITGQDGSYLVDACLFLMKHDFAVAGPGSTASEHLFNVGCGDELTISDLLALVQGVVGYSGSVVWDDSKPDGTPRKLMDVSRMNGLGWQSRISLRDGIAGVDHDYCSLQ